MPAPVVLVHGLIGSLSAPLITGAFNRPVLTPDLIGYGDHASDPRMDWTLEDQADHLARWIADHVAAPVHLVGHSVGGAVAVLLAHRAPEMVRSLTSVEGNFTPSDAFWSRSIAGQGLGEVRATLDGFRADVPAWLRESGVEPDAARISIAAEWLDNQPAETVRSQARAVVAATEGGAYLDAVRDLLASGLPLHLLAGSRSSSGWGVPQWVRDRATSDAAVDGAGHLLMIERPAEFADSVLAPLPA